MHHALARLAARRLTCRAGLRPALEPLDPRTLLAADLGIELATSLPSFVVPGDKLALAARVTNRGDAAMSGPVTVRFLAPDASGEPSQVATITRSLSLAPGKSTVLSTRWTVTDAAPPGEHDFAAMLEPSAFTGSATDDVATRDGGFTLRYLFGTFGNRRNILLSTTDEDGTVVTFGLRGAGYGEFRPAEFEGERAGLDLVGTDGSTQFTIVAKGGDAAATLENTINVAGSLRRIDAKAIDFTGSLAIGGTLGEFAARDLDELDMTIAGAGAPMRFLARDVSNLRLTTATPVAQMDVASWQWLVASGDDSPDATSTITAPWIGRLNVKRDFSALTSLTGVGAPANSLGAARIGGTFGGQFAIVGNVGSFTAATVDSGMLISSGTVGSFAAATTTMGSVWARSLLKLDLGTADRIDVATGCTFDATALPALTQGNGAVITWGQGAIGSIAVRGSLGCGRFACGVDPGDGSVLNADDAIAGRGAIGKIEIRGTADDLIIAATTLPPSARIGGVIVRTELDTRFMWLDDSELPG
ncbi:MAG: hypothetical protein ACOYPS_14275 [Phycisphaerales bacterium]